MDNNIFSGDGENTVLLWYNMFLCFDVKVLFLT